MPNFVMKIHLQNNQNQSKNNQNKNNQNGLTQKSNKSMALLFKASNKTNNNIINMSIGKSGGGGCGCGK